MDEAPEPNPIVYLSRQNGKRIAVCLSTFGKWAAGVFATLFTTATLAMFTMIWSSAVNSKAALDEIKAVRESIEKYESTNDDRHRDFEQRLRDIERSTRA